MRNNFKITIIKTLLIIIFLISNTYSIEEFNFDITEIEISDNGNKFKGLKRGSATSDNGLIIEADIFEYDKLTNILNAYGTVEINDLVNNYVIFTDNITYIKDKETIFTKGERGSATSDNGLIIEADIFEYDKLTNILNAYGTVEITDLVNNYVIFTDNITYIKDKETIFTKGETKAIIESKYNFLSKNVTLLRAKKELYSSEFTEVKDDKFTQYNLNEFRFYIDKNLLKGKNIDVISDYTKIPENRELYSFKDGIFNLETKNFNASDTKIFLEKNVFGLNKSLFSLNFEENNNLTKNQNAPRVYGVSSSKKGEITKINKGTFTSCGFNDGCPPWHIDAESITHDSFKKQLTYKNAFLNIYNLPVLYFPKFFHPDPTVKRQSGLLTPQINSSDILGTSIITPYFHVISDNKDLTLTPTIFDSEIEMLQMEYRQENRSSSFIADMAHVRGYQSNISQNRNSISHLFAKYESVLNLSNFNKSLLKLNLEKVSNDTYLKIFDTNLIDKQIKPQNQNSLSSALNLYLNADDYNLDIGMSLSENLSGANSDRYQYILPYYNYDRNLGSNKFGNFNFSSSGYNNHLNTNSIQTVVNNNLNFLSNDFISKGGLQNNFGIYFKNLNSLGKNYSNYKNSPQSEISSIYNFETKYPLIKPENNHINYLTPKLSFRFNPGDMKDYSGASRSINSDNIFAIDRLSIGGDSFEEGQSITAGIDYKKENIDNINKYFSFNLASVFRDKEQVKIPNSSTIRSKSSNIIGSANYSLSDNYLLGYDFSLDNNFKNFEYNSISATYKKNNFMTTFNFIEQNGKIGQTNSIENTTEFKFYNDNYLYFNTRRNRETNLTEYYDLIYEYKNDCLIANIKYKKTYYADRDVVPNEDIFLSLTLFPLTTFEQKVNPNLYRNN